MKKILAGLALCMVSSACFEVVATSDPMNNPVLSPRLRTDLVGQWAGTSQSRGSLRSFVLLIEESGKETWTIAENGNTVAKFESSISNVFESDPPSYSSVIDYVPVNLTAIPYWVDTNSTCTYRSDRGAGTLKVNCSIDRAGYEDLRQVELHAVVA